jgi:threonyl-tRNA synthetase
LFSIQDEIGAGLILWHPKGARIRHLVEDFWKKEHFKAGYELLYTPHVGKAQLWETSGHLGFYRENMYNAMEVEEQDYYIKPMNCPFHILIYKSKLRSYRELPLRWAELGTVYRYERSGVLHGLMRVRGFTQDDAHLMCTEEQMVGEIERVLTFCLDILTSFGFKEYKLYLSTKPKEKSVGDVAKWESAQQALEQAIKKVNLPFEIDEGGGAFYGPKIDLKIKDAIGREWQCSTIQFDFNLPERFDMTYIGPDGNKHQPYMIHRALFVSLERFFGILIEHYAGKFPFWLAPVQVKILTISDKVHAYANTVKDKLLEAGIRLEMDFANEKIGAKIRTGINEKVPYLLIIGEKEAAENKVAVRSRDKGDLGAVSVENLLEIMG